MVQPVWDAQQGQWMRSPRPIAGLGRAASIMAVISAVVALLEGFSAYYDYTLARDYLAGHGVSISEILAADRRVSLLATLFLICMLAAAVLVIVWTYQARTNAELICTAEHRRARGWVIGAWFCPVVNLWFPAMIMEDIYRASMPTTRYDQVSFLGMPSAGLVRAWWAPWVLSNVIGVILTRNAANDLDGLHTRSVGLILESLLLVAAAVMLSKVIRQISTWQLEPKTA